MNFRIGQFYRWKDSIGKITNINDNFVMFRKYSLGTTTNGYSYQTYILKSNLIEKIKSKEIQNINSEKILKIIFFWFHEECNE